MFWNVWDCTISQCQCLLDVQGDLILDHIEKGSPWCR